MHGTFAKASILDDDRVTANMTSILCGGVCYAASAVLVLLTLRPRLFIWCNKQFVSFKVVVQTDDDHWTLRRPYSDFAALDEELPEEVRADCTLPLETYDDRKLILWKERPRSMKSRLEMYLKKVLHHPKLAPYASQALCEFLEMEYVEDVASARSYYSNSIV
ncbi:unnamed protein product [Peronospora belbahrii]|uniref:PX domain-containing protein n=1 Tax=Peronospora belbahrii TaxID=622444 RepID=A0AAU9KX31_9STRA|nr:unnamed protein product [Peronospora belbahrii]